MSRADLLEHVWYLNFETGSNVVDVYINFLRKKSTKALTPSSSTRWWAWAT
ncbi:MAG: winged helix-turn-helix domain-containing protein [Janthinobacterium lividum]